MKHLWTVAAAFAAGATATYCLGRALMAPRLHVPRSDDQLREQIRGRMAGLVSQPGAIDVDVQNGIVRVSGEILATEVDGLLSKLTQMVGVYKVHNALTALKNPGPADEADDPAGTTEFQT
jgi:osmotically-inducible protein OsmY